VSVLVLVLLAAAAAVVVGRDRGPGKPVATKYGVTSQGRAFELKLDGRGRPVAFSTELAAMCPSGRMVSMPWDATDGDGVVFRRAGTELRVAEKGDTYELVLDGTVEQGGALKGTTSLVVHVRPQTRAPYDCTSPRVRVTAGR
jgi:hypothetical protein